MLQVTVEHKVSVPTLQHISKNFSLPEAPLEEGDTASIIELRRGAGTPPLRAHAHVLAKLGGVLAVHCDPKKGFAARPIDTSEAPYVFCAPDTLKILVGFAYLSDSENVRAAIAALPMREQCALVDLVQFLRAGSGDSPLKTLQRLCNEAIKAAALALTQ